MIPGVLFMRNVYTVMAYAPAAANESSPTAQQGKVTALQDIEPMLGLMALNDPTEALVEFNRVKVPHGPIDLDGSSTGSGASSSSGSGPGGRGRERGKGVWGYRACSDIGLLCAVFFVVRVQVMVVPQAVYAGMWERRWRECCRDWG